MPLEIERKYLVDVSALPPLQGGAYLEQGYLAETPCTRIRLSTQDSIKQAFITIKGSGFVARPEFEYAIPVADAREMLDTLTLYGLSKIRHIIMIDGWKWELDQFQGSLSGFWMAEIELPSGDTVVNKPSWALEEVSYDARYTNLSLAKYGLPK